MSIDPTTTSAWSELTQLAKTPVNLAAAFAADENRAARYTLRAGDLVADLSKNLITDEIITQLLALADQTQVAEYRERMYRGERINVTEDRSVLHTALRRPAGDELEVDGENVVDAVHRELEKVFTFATQVRTGQWRGVSGKRITDVVNIGIGGSDLGPMMAYEALKPYVSEDVTCHFVSNIDPSDIADTTAHLDAETTLVIVASKTFTTLETLTNARLARTWLLDSLRAAGVITADEDNTAVARHFVAVSTALDKVAAFGIDPNNAFGFWDWVGGRYSVDSAIGTALAVAIGPERFREFLTGFHTMDQHFATAEPKSNLPLLMGLLNVWYVNFLDAHTHAILPYDQHLHRFAAYLQQLTMESNGKRVRADGSEVNYHTGEVFWGEPGTNGQHAFYQLIHQGSRLIPCDFIAMANPAHALRDGDQDVHELFLANFFAQSKALAFGKSAEQVRAEGTAEAIVPARVFPGNKPSTSIMAARLSPKVLGELIALYEHITFVQGAVWGIDSFDQWGVELGKQLASALAPAVAGDREALKATDASTRNLINTYLQLRE
ncbi:MAG: glucose-6-phosphate isomerase [Bowdeniella nasicola]|nr:glucose-6-phosphate isomerase [Bowdeniella nasicola]